MAFSDAARDATPAMAPASRAPSCVVFLFRAFRVAGRAGAEALPDEIGRTMMPERYRGFWLLAGDQDGCGGRIEGGPRFCLGEPSLEDDVVPSIGTVQLHDPRGDATPLELEHRQGGPRSAPHWLSRCDTSGDVLGIEPGMGQVVIRGAAAMWREGGQLESHGPAIS